MLEGSTQAMTETFNQGAGFSYVLVVTIFAALALVVFSIWVITGISKTMKSDNHLNPSEKMYSILMLIGLVIAWVAFIATFF